LRDFFMSAHLEEFRVCLSCFIAYYRELVGQKWVKKWVKKAVQKAI
jgi:hypothetical protein